MTKPGLLVLFQGAPGVGKSTLSHEIAKRTGLILLGKDDIKEMLFDTIQQSNRDFLTTQGLASIMMLYAFAESMLKSGHDVIIDAALNAEFARQDLKNRVLSSTGADVLEIYCHTDEQMRMSRFRQRTSTTRHPAHMDHLETFDGNSMKRFTPLAIGDVVDIDTTAEFDEVLFDKIIKAIKEHQKEVK